ncbi:hypothetical protein D3C78_1959350 [compost metagenome]
MALAVIQQPTGHIQAGRIKQGAIEAQRSLAVEADVYPTMALAIDREGDGVLSACESRRVNQ